MILLMKLKLHLICLVLVSMSYFVLSIISFVSLGIIKRTHPLPIKLVKPK